MMSNLFWLSDEQMARLQHYFGREMAASGLMTGVF